MRQEVTFTQQAIGKTIEAVKFAKYAQQGIMTFTDGTFATIGIDHGYEAGDADLVDEQLMVLGFGDADLISLGILTAEELAAKRKERDDSVRQNQEDRERSEFERLKAKFT